MEGTLATSLLRMHEAERVALAEAVVLQEMITEDEKSAASTDVAVGAESDADAVAIVEATPLNEAPEAATEVSIAPVAVTEVSIAPEAATEASIAPEAATETSMVETALDVAATEAKVDPVAAADAPVSTGAAIEQAISDTAEAVSISVTRRSMS